MSKTTTRRVKAWAVIVYNDFISNFRSHDGFGGRAVFFDEKEACLCRKHYLKELAGTVDSAQNPTVVPIIITYKLPTPNKGKGRK